MSDERPDPTPSTGHAAEGSESSEQLGAPYVHTDSVGTTLTITAGRDAALVTVEEEGDGLGPIRAAVGVSTHAAPTVAAALLSAAGMLAFTTDRDSAGPLLLAEVERLRRLLDEAAETAARAGREREEARAERDRAREETNQLRELVDATARGRNAAWIAARTAELARDAMRAKLHPPGDSQGHCATCGSPFPCPRTAPSALGEPAQLRTLPREVRDLVHSVDAMRDHWAESSEDHRRALWRRVHDACDSVWSRTDTRHEGPADDPDEPAQTEGARILDRLDRTEHPVCSRVDELIRVVRDHERRLTLEPVVEFVARLSEVDEAIEEARASASTATELAERVKALEARASVDGDPRVEKLVIALDLDAETGTSDVLAAIQRQLGDIQRTGRHGG